MKGKKKNRPDATVHLQLTYTNRVTRHLFCCWRLPLIKMVSDFSTPWANFVS